LKLGKRDDERQKRGRQGMRGKKEKEGRKRKQGRQHRRKAENFNILEQGKRRKWMGRDSVRDYNDKKERRKYLERRQLIWKERRDNERGDTLLEIIAEARASGR
jgi:hypothetical protein